MKFLNRNSIRSLAALALVAVGLFTVSPPAAQAAPLQVFAGTGSQVETNLEYYVVSANGVGTPVITFYDVTSDHSTSGVLTFKTASNARTVTATSSSTTINAPGTGYAANDILLAWHKSTDTYERLTVSASSSTTITTSSALASSLAVGDMVFEMTAAGDILIGSANKQVNAPGGIYAGTRGAPLLLELAGAGTGTVDINIVSGYYLKP